MKGNRRWQEQKQSPHKEIQMKTILFRITAIAMLAAMSSFAQNYATFQASVPFDFTLGNKTMPSGQYFVEPSLKPNVVVIRSADQKHNYVIMGASVTSHDQTTAKLVFHRYGDQYFLSEVWTRGDDRGTQLPVTPRERELISQQSRSAAQVTLALR
jgi:hypothetical protein